MRRDRAEIQLPVRQGDLLLGKYLIGEVLGAGGMGVVVAAEHVQLGQKVAVKFLPPAWREKADRVARFVREARAAARIRSEHVVRVVDVSAPDSEICYMVMEYLEGVDLANLLHTRGRLPPEEAVGYVLQACEALAEAHGAGIVHRDLKPSNLFLTKRRDGSPLIKVLDFGISKVAVSTTGDGPITDLTATMAVMGSPVYMSPEQVRSSKTVDARTDIWSLGVILHELVTGLPVYVSPSATELLAMIVADPPTPLRQIVPGLPASLEVTVLACLEKQASERLPDVATLAARLQPLAPRWAALSVERIVGAAGTTTSPPDPPPAVVRPAHDRTQALPATATTSAQLSGELVPAEQQGDAPRAAADPVVKRPVGAGRATARRRTAALSAGVVVAAGALIITLGRSPRRGAAPDGAAVAPRPAAYAPPARAQEAPPALAERKQEAAPKGLDGSLAAETIGAPLPQQPGVIVRDMSPAEIAAANAKIDARADAERTKKLEPKHPEPGRVARKSPAHKPPPPPAREEAPPIPAPASAPKDPLDGRR